MHKNCIHVDIIGVVDTRYLDNITDVFLLRHLRRPENTMFKQISTEYLCYSQLSPPDL